MIKRASPVGSLPRVLILCMPNEQIDMPRWYSLSLKYEGLHFTADVILQSQDIRRKSTVSSACPGQYKMYALRPARLYHLSHHNVRDTAASSAASKLSATYCTDRGNLRLTDTANRDRTQMPYYPWHSVAAYRSLVTWTVCSYSRWLRHILRTKPDGTDVIN